MRKFHQVGGEFDDQSLQQLPNAFYLGMFGIYVAVFLLHTVEFASIKKMKQVGKRHIGH